MNKRIAVPLVPAAASLLVLTACGDEAPADNGAESNGLAPAALIIAQGGLGDESFNDLAYEGFQAAQERHGIEGSAIESADIVSQGAQVLRRAGQENFGLVTTLEFTHANTLPAVAAEFPDTNWVMVNAEAEGDNVASVIFDEHEASFLAGALAAIQTSNSDDPRINAEQNIIGVIGGTQSVGIDKFIVGYIQGAREIDPDIQVLTAYSDGFDDPALGQQLAESMFQDGADIIFQVAGGTGSGVIQAAVDYERYAIGVDDNQDGIAPGAVLTSVLKRVDVGLETVMDTYAAGEFPGGEIVRLGLEDDAVALTEFEHTLDAIGQEVVDQIAELRQQISDGEIDVWDVVEQGYPDFYSGS